MYKILITTTIEKLGMGTGYAVGVHTVVVEFDTLEQVELAAKRVRSTSRDRDVSQRVVELF